ncbi:hypothetical protein [Desulfolutivibrio sulfoxidireducens]|uniref:hypothetical protein n=1 Tax=Desulfolutivibrio sulfoxidireducens TaxID=2773299 RepID=UPI00159E355A|nr:hypothetical protein [Desulfolutivibrio sulfoxidireducens]QLA18676.1 hypothetical protein GD604_02490 [Desulfolutivibrio sulfoxidireducens]
MRHRSPILTVTPVVLVAAVLFLWGCKKTVHGLDIGNVAYTRAHTLVRSAPEASARTVLSVGPNVQVRIAERSGGYSRVTVDDGRVAGWVETSALTDAPVSEATAPAAPQKTGQARPVGKKAKPAAPESADKTPEQAAPAPETVATPPRAEEPAETAAPAKAQDSGQGGLLSPREAQAAPPPVEQAPAAPPVPPPAKGKQARPEAFDPF